MAETIQPSGVSGPSWPRRLRHTPWTDVLRGRLTGRLDWRAALEASGLPANVRTLIADVVRRTRLWRSEQADVARELIAHFADGLDAGETADVLIADFGESRTAAALIRRAKKRQRSWVWTVRLWFYRGLGVLALLYLVVVVRYYTGSPTPTVDYVAKLNEPVLAVPEGDRAWPLLLRARPLLDADAKEPATVRITDVLENPTTPPDEKAIADWVAAHREGIELLHQAAAKPALGFVFGPGGSAGDLLVSQREPKPRLETMLVEVLLPYLNDTRYFATCLRADARVAAAAGDSRRLVADVRAILALADQADRPPRLVVTGYVAIGMRHVALGCVGETLATRPQALDDRALIELAHLLAGPKVAADLISLEAERLSFHDLVQRTYTDDGEGDGRITAEGFKAWRRIGPVLAGDRMEIKAIADHWQGKVLMPGLLVTQASRKEIVDVVDRYYAASSAALHKPLREAGNSDDAAQAIVQNPWRYRLASDTLPSSWGVSRNAEIYLGRRDGVTVGLALELFKRRHGAYPKTLDELAPALLPTVPVDRIDGGPLRYRVVEGRPVVYSVGYDRVDDGGRPAGRADEVYNITAARWPSARVPEEVHAQQRGDWVLYSGVVPDPAATRPADAGK